MVHAVIESMEIKENKVEMVEVKGLGHPDTMCDALVDEGSNVLSKYYLKHFGKVLHHNIDKALIVAGRSKPKFGGGRIVEPMRIIIAGRATTKVGNVAVPAKDLISKVVKKYMARFEFADYELEIDIKEGASNLKEVFKRSVQVANDTSIGAASFPMTAVEKLVKDTAEHVVSDAFRKKFKGVGYDVKVMGIRVDKDVVLTIGLAFVDHYIRDMEHYKQLKHDIRAYLEDWSKAAVHINTLDSFKDEESIYLTVTGLSAEQGDDGQAGRGNRFNGMITPFRCMSIESYAGKNVSHPGKIYQVMADVVAKDLVKKAKLDAVDVRVVTEIGKPLNEPFLVSVKAAGKIDLKQMKEIVDDAFSRLEKIQRNVIFS